MCQHGATAILTAFGQICKVNGSPAGKCNSCGSSFRLGSSFLLPATAAELRTNKSHGSLAAAQPRSEQITQEIEIMQCPPPPHTHTIEPNGFPISNLWVFLFFVFFSCMNHWGLEWVELAHLVFHAPWVTDSVTQMSAVSAVNGRTFSSAQLRLYFFFLFLFFF